ncbi:cyclin-dependent kinase 2-like [Haliotis asinina]|uniref:cyclin-dependent kinase 2-like n=1 Tax=Haliotis asinina TaxID=109174 RepID=UPI003531A18E
MGQSGSTEDCESSPNVSDSSMSFKGSYTSTHTSDIFTANYDLLGNLGEGSFGVVYKAKNRQTNDVHAVKKIKFTVDVTQREKFVRETELLKEIKGHENIVSLIDILSDRHDLYIVLEFCDLGDLDHYVAGTYLSVDSKVLLMYDMSNGLDFLHQNNIVHRDLKSANVLVTSSEVHGRPLCKIADFGEAKIQAFTGHLSNMASNPFPSYLTSAHGTMAYIAPEVLQYHYTKSCDVFSLGVIFYALFTHLFWNGMTNILNPFVDDQCMYEVSFDKIKVAVKGLKALPKQSRKLTLKMLKTDYHQRAECGTVKDTLSTYIRNPETGTGNKCILS